MVETVEASLVLPRAREATTQQVQVAALTEVEAEEIIVEEIMGEEVMAEDHLEAVRVIVQTGGLRRVVLRSQLTHTCEKFLLTELLQAPPLHQLRLQHLLLQ